MQLCLGLCRQEEERRRRRKRTRRYIRFQGGKKGERRGLGGDSTGSTSPTVSSSSTNGHRRHENKSFVSFTTRLGVVGRLTIPVVPSYRTPTTPVDIAGPCRPALEPAGQRVTTTRQRRRKEEVRRARTTFPPPDRPTPRPVRPRFARSTDQTSCCVFVVFASCINRPSLVAFVGLKKVSRTSTL